MDPVSRAAIEPLERWVDGLLSVADGRSFDFRLPDGRRMAGELRDFPGAPTIEGRFEAPFPGRFLFVRNAETGRIDGGLIHADNGSFAYRVEAGNPPRWVPTGMDELLCVNKGSEGLPVPPEESEILLPPEAHPEGEDVPDYQNGIISLQSKPGAPNVIYIDLDGEKGPFDYWGDFDASSAGFSKQQAINVWRGVAEDYLPFNVNVTTDLEVFLAAPKTKRMRCIMTRTRNSKNHLDNAGGVALVGSFKWDSDVVCWSRASTGASGAVIVSHEIGHTMGLHHDGNSNADYEDGYGSGAESWGPIMGAPYGRELMQWSKGDYPGANNPENDVNIIGGVVGKRADLIGDLIADASPLRVLPDGTVDEAHIIEDSGDLDTYHFRTNGGAVTLKAECATTSPNVNMKLLVYDSAATLLFEENHPDYKNVTYNGTLPAGDYYVKVGGAERVGSGAFPAYGSIGAFKLAGTIENAVAPQRFSVEEATEPFTPLGSVVPWDDHGGSTLTYSIVGGNSLGYFAIDSTTGTLSVAPDAYITRDAIVTDWRFLPEVTLQVSIEDAGNPSANEIRTVYVEVTVPEETFEVLANRDFEATPFDAGWGNSGLATLAAPGLSGSPQGAHLNGTGVLAQEIPGLTDFRLKFAVQPTSIGVGQSWQLDLARDPAGSAGGELVDSYPAVADTYLRESSNSNFYNTNWGNDRTDGGEFILGGNGNGDMRPMLRFDLSGLSPEASQSITSATLEVTGRSSSASSGSLVTHAYLYPHDFVEGTGDGDSAAGNGATWNDPDGDDTDVPGGIDPIAGGTLGSLLSTTSVPRVPGPVTFPTSANFTNAVTNASGGNLNLILDPDRFNPSTTFGPQDYVRMPSRESGSGVATLTVHRSANPLTYTPVIRLRGTTTGGLEVHDGSDWVPVPGSSGALANGQRTHISLTLRRFPEGTRYDLEWSDPGGFGLAHSAPGMLNFSNAPDADGIEMLAFAREQLLQGTAIVDQISLDPLPAAELVNGDFEKQPSLIYWHHEGTEISASFDTSSSTTSLRFPWNVPSYAYQHVQPARDFTFTTRFQVAGLANPALRFYLHGAGFGTGDGNTLIGLRVNTGGALQTSIDGTWLDLLDDSTNNPTSFAINTTYVVKVIGRDFGLPSARWDLIWYPASNPTATRSVTAIPFFESPKAATSGDGAEFVRFNQLGVSSHSYWIDDVSFVPMAEASPAADSHVDGLKPNTWHFLDWAGSFGVSPLLGVEGIHALSADGDGLGALVEYLFGLSPDSPDVIGDRQIFEHQADGGATLTLVVRDDDPNLSIIVETSETMAAGEWTAIDPAAELRRVDQDGVDPGFRRRVFVIPGGAPARFARVVMGLE